VTKAIAYVRVSTEEQANEGESLRAQKERLQAYCLAKDWQLVDVVEDAGKSGKDLKRPGILSILRDCQNKVKTFDTILITRLDRLTRSVRDLAELSDYFKERQINLASISENVDTGTPTGELFYNIIASLSQWERKKIGERTREVLAYKKSNGERTGTIPYGFQMSGRSRLEAMPAEQAILERIRELKSLIGYHKIAKLLNAERVPAKNGGKWYPGTVRSVLGGIRIKKRHGLSELLRAPAADLQERIVYNRTVVYA